MLERKLYFGRLFCCSRCCCWGVDGMSVLNTDAIQVLVILRTRRPGKIDFQFQHIYCIDSHSSKHAIVYISSSWSSSLVSTFYNNSQYNTDTTIFSIGWRRQRYRYILAQQSTWLDREHHAHTQDALCGQGVALDYGSAEHNPSAGVSVALANGLPIQAQSCKSHPHL